MKCDEHVVDLKRSPWNLGPETEYARTRTL
jgi:hypothetical protein